MESDNQCSPVLDALDVIKSFLDEKDMKERQELSEIRTDPNSPLSQEKTIKMLIKILKCLQPNIFCQQSRQENLKNELKKDGQKENSATIQRLLSHLESHVNLLESISHNPELASLFLVGSNGSHSFNSLQKSILVEQASRLRFFISQFHIPSQPNCSSLNDHRKSVKPAQLNVLSEKLKELNKIKESVNESSDLVQTRNAFREVCSLLETSVLFNDILLQNFNNDNMNEKNQKLEKQIESIKNKKEIIENQLNKIKAQLHEQKRSHENNNSSSNQKKQYDHYYKKKIEKLESEKRELLAKIETDKKNVTVSPKEYQSIKIENGQLTDQIDILNKQIKNYQEIIAQNEEKNNSLKKKMESRSEKCKKIQQLYSKQRSEIESLQNLYKNVTSQNFELNEQNETNHTIIDKLQKDLNAAKKECKDLKQLLERANETNQEQMKENGLLIKQIRKNDNLEIKESFKNEISQLKSKITILKKKLNEANEFILSLQDEINKYKIKKIDKSEKLKHKTQHSPQKLEKTLNEKPYSKSLNKVNDKSFDGRSFKKMKNREINFSYSESDDDDESSSGIDVDESSFLCQKTGSDVSSSASITESSKNRNKRPQINNSIMPSFDELERDIKNLELSVKRTRSLVSEKLNE
ncbi:hypothetical protein TRFO_36923 [Tritrichomonas foetus]|uniref:Uncharacterized protein n=1 Tax=Tritrichomonas foetus TaxID=1144522 RepID=A0A1J4JCR1_9EUKA|nr:hypothetical protein TRFO_36923 [Tritrichomonas foetus]|eukprot:OHS96966.1 hypothetical protein TRFO_36923 [Tritrichomonas foetus]